MPAAPTFQDRSYSTAFAVSAFVKQTALDGVKDLLLGEQEFCQNAADFTPQDLNSPHPDEVDPTNPVWILVEETNFQDLGAGVIQWTRRYARQPSTYSRVEGTIAYNFIGYFGTFGINPTTVTGRGRFTDIVALRVQRDYYIVGPESYADYATPQEIPIIQEQKYYITDEDQRTDYLGDDTILDTPSTPTRTDYEAMIAAQDEIVAQPSKVSPWQGNIYVRETFYIKAK